MPCVMGYDAENQNKTKKTAIYIYIYIYGDILINPSSPAVGSPDVPCGVGYEAELPVQRGPSVWPGAVPDSRHCTH